jgi:hypothetical protein
MLEEEGGALLLVREEGEGPTRFAGIDVVGYCERGREVSNLPRLLELEMSVVFFFFLPMQNDLE